MYSRTHGQLRSRRRSSPRRSANGSSRSAAGAVRKKTSAGGGSSRTATRMNRYGMPQITQRVMKSSQPLRDTGVLPSNGAVILPAAARCAARRGRPAAPVRPAARDRQATGIRLRDSGVFPAFIRVVKVTVRDE